MNNKYPHQGIAQILADKGREGDTMLVHMAPNEVAALQKIAQDNGTSLTINPHTGLPEAISLNPFSGHSSGGLGSTVAGVLGGIIGLDPGVTGLLVGASQWISQGDFEDGVVAGLSAYGGAQLGGSLSNWAQNKINLFREGYGSTAPTMPTIGGNKVESISGWDKSGNFQPGWDAQGNPISNAPTISAPAITDPEIMEMSGNIPSALKTPEQVQTALSKPVTIEAKNAAANKWYIPDAIENSPIYKGLANMAKTPAPTAGGVAGIPGQAGAPSNAGGNTLNAYQLAMLGPSVAAAQKQDEAAKIQEQKDREAATPTPYTFTSGVGFHQVRNPMYGKRAGEPMYIQYYDKGTAGPTYTGPGQGSIRDMTPTELQNYQQTGKFTPGMASGGLAGLHTKKVEAFATGGSTSLEDLQRGIQEEYAYANRKPLPQTGPQMPAYFQWLRGDFDAVSPSSTTSTFSYPSYTGVPTSTTPDSSTYNTFTNTSTSTFDSSTYTTPPRSTTLDTTTYSSISSTVTPDSSTYTTAPSTVTPDSSTYTTAPSTGTLDTSTYTTGTTTGTLDTSTYTTGTDTTLTLDSSTYTIKSSTNTLDTSTYTTGTTAGTLDTSTYTTGTTAGTLDTSTYTTGTGTTFTLDGTTYTTGASASTTGSSTYSTIASSPTLDTTSETPPTDPFTTGSSTYSTIASSSALDATSETQPTDPFTTGSSTYNTIASSSALDATSETQPTDAFTTSSSVYSTLPNWKQDPSGNWYDLNNTNDASLFSSAMTSYLEYIANVSKVNSLSLTSTRTNTSTYSTSTKTSTTDSSTYSSTSSSVNDGAFNSSTYNTLTSTSSSVYNTLTSSSTTSSTIYKTTDQYGNPIAVPSDWKDIPKADQSLLSKVWTFLTTPLFKDKLSDNEAWKATQDFMNAEGKHWSSNALLLLYNSLRAGLLGPGVALGTNAFSLLTGFGFNHPNIPDNDPTLTKILKGLANANPTLGMDENVVRLINEGRKELFSDSKDGGFTDSNGNLITDNNGNLALYGGFSWDEGFDPKTGAYQQSNYSVKPATFFSSNTPYQGNDSYARELINGNRVVGTITKTDGDGNNIGIPAYYTPIATGVRDPSTGRIYKKDFGITDEPISPKTGDDDLEEVFITAEGGYYTKEEYLQDEANKKAAWEAQQKAAGYDPASGKTSLIEHKDSSGNVYKREYVTKEDAFQYKVNNEKLTYNDYKLLALYGNINPNDIITRGIDAIIAHDYGSTTDAKGIPVEGSLFNARGELVGVNRIDSSTGFIGSYFNSIGMTNNTQEAADALRLAQAKLIEYRKDNFLNEDGSFNQAAWDENYRLGHGGLSYEEEMAKQNDLTYRSFRQNYVNSGLFPILSQITKFWNDQYDEEGNFTGYGNPTLKNYDDFLKLSQTNPEDLKWYINKAQEVKPILDKFVSDPDLLNSVITRSDKKYKSIDDIMEGYVKYGQGDIIKQLMADAEQELWETRQADTGQWRPGWGQYDTGESGGSFGPSFNIADWVGGRDTGYQITVEDLNPSEVFDSNPTWTGPNTINYQLYKTNDGTYYDIQDGKYTLVMTTNPDGSLNWYKPAGQAKGGLIGLAQGGGIVNKKLPEVQHFANQGAVNNDIYGGLQAGLYASKTKGKSGITDLLPEIKAAKRGSPPSMKSPESIRSWARNLSGVSDSDTESVSPLIAYIKSLSGETDTANKFAPGGEIPQNGGNGIPEGYYPASGGEDGPGGHLLNGPGDGMSDSIDAMITGDEPQRAALADGEFVISADVVSHIGNGSTKAGAAKLYDLMDQIRKARTGTTEQAPQINADKYLNKLR